MKVLWGIIILSFLSCGHSVQDASLFSLVPSEHTGIYFRNDLKHTAEFNMYTYRNFYNGGGVGMGDINNDGLLD